MIASLSIWCQVDISQWIPTRRGLHSTTRRFYKDEWWDKGLQTKKGIVWFEGSTDVPLLYVKKKGNAFIIVSLYVDDIIYSISFILWWVNLSLKWWMSLRCQIWGYYVFFLVLKSIKLKIKYFFYKRNMPMTFSLSLVC